MNAWTEEYLSASFADYDDSLEQDFGFPNICKYFSHLPAGASVLDYGCGAGALTAHLVDMGFNVWGADISEFALEKARKNIVNRHVKFIHTDRILPNIIFEGVASAFVLCTVANRADIASIFAKLGKCMARGGYYVILDFNIASAGVDFGTFQAGLAGHMYSDGDILPVKMRKRDGSIFDFEDIFWDSRTLRACAVDTGYFRFCEEKSRCDLLPPNKRGQPFKILTFERI